MNKPITKREGKTNKNAGEDRKREELPLGKSVVIFAQISHTLKRINPVTL